jgi:hypothetical protein
MNNKGKILGIIVPDKDRLKFFLTETNLGNIRVSDNLQISETAKVYLGNFYTDPISFNYVLEQAGVIFTTKEDCEIDLSPEKLDKNTIINLLKV